MQDAQKQAAAIIKAQAMIEAGEETNAVLEYLRSEGFGEEDSQNIIHNISFDLQNKAANVASLADLMSTAHPIEEAAVVESPAETPVQAAPSTSPMDVRRQKELVNMAITLLDGGYNEDYVRQKLIKEGLSYEESNKVLARLTAARRQVAFTQAANKTKADYPQASYRDQSQIWIGIAMIVIGCGITFFSYQAAASNPNGGTYIITFGLVIAGAFRVFRGLSG